MLLYLTSNQKSGLIDGVTREMLMPSKKLVGKFSLKSFVTKDMRNYATAKFFLIDAACIEESGEDFTLALRSFQMMFSARIIVILSGCEDMSGCIQQLLSIGVVNLITAETLEEAADELKEALSDEGMQRYVTPMPVSSQPESQREPAPEPEAEIIPYRWNAKNIRIAVAGTQRRSGVTVTAFNLAAWLTARGAEVAYIEVNTNRHLQLLLNVICIIFIDIKDDQMTDLMFCQLGTDLTADGSAASGYQNRFSFDIAKDLIQIDFDGISAQQIFDLNVTQF